MTGKTTPKHRLLCDTMGELALRLQEPNFEAVKPELVHLVATLIRHRNDPKLRAELRSKAGAYLQQRRRAN